MEKKFNTEQNLEDSRMVESIDSYFQSIFQFPPDDIIIERLPKKRRTEAMEEALSEISRAGDNANTQNIIDQLKFFWEPWVTIIRKYKKYNRVANPFESAMITEEKVSKRRSIKVPSIEFETIKKHSSLIEPIETEEAIKASPTRIRIALNHAGTTLAKRNPKSDAGIRKSRSNLSPPSEPPHETPPQFLVFDTDFTEFPSSKADIINAEKRVQIEIFFPN